MAKEPQTATSSVPAQMNDSTPFFRGQSTAAMDRDFFEPSLRGYELPEPEVAAQAPAAAKAAAPGAHPIGDHETQLRAELVAMFNHYANKVVGDPEFDDVITEAAWDKKKAKEQVIIDANTKKEEDYNKALAKYNKSDKSGPPPVKEKAQAVNPYTTCIEVQRKVLEHAMSAAGLNVKKVTDHDQQTGKALKNKPKVRTFGYGTLGPEQAQEIGGGAWHPGSLKMTDRPKEGDILIFANRGKEVDEAAKNIAGLEGMVARGDDTQQAAAAFGEAAEKAKAALAEAEADTSAANAKQKLKAAKMAVIAAQNKFALAKAKAVSAAKSAKTAQGLMPAAVKRLEDKRAASTHTNNFFFSHVSYFVSREKTLGPDGKEDGTETWTTFDGGQQVKARGGKQGASFNKRIYHPDTNEIAGEASQGGAARWFQGWIDIDKLGEQKP